MKLIKIFLFMLTVWMITSFFIINDIVKEKNRLIIEKENLFTIDEAMLIYSEGHKKGGLRFAGNQLNFKAFFNEKGFKTDTTLFRRTLEKALK